MLCVGPVSEAHQHAILASPPPPPLSHTAARLALASTPGPPVKKSQTSASFRTSPNPEIQLTAAAFPAYFLAGATIFSVAAVSQPSLYIPASRGSQHLPLSPLACPPSPPPPPPPSAALTQVERTDIRRQRLGERLAQREGPPCYPPFAFLAVSRYFLSPLPSFVSLASASGSLFLSILSPLCAPPPSRFSFRFSSRSASSKCDHLCTAAGCRADPGRYPWIWVHLLEYFYFNDACMEIIYVGTSGKLWIKVSDA